jgi:hypothetical protein
VFNSTGSKVYDNFIVHDAIMVWESFTRTNRVW